MSPSREALEDALSQAASAHHEYETTGLEGARDEQWNAFYAAYVLGRLGDFAAPSALARALDEAPEAENWAASAAAHVVDQLLT